MNRALNGFVELPAGGGNFIYLRLSSIDAIWSGVNRTFIQLRGCPNSDDACITILGLPEVLALMAAAQNG